MTHYDALHRKQLCSWAHQPTPLFPIPGEEDSLISLTNVIGIFPAMAGIEVSKVQPALSNTFSHQQTISLNQNYI